MNAVLSSLMAQWRACKGDRCRVKDCARCQRAEAFCRKENKDGIAQRLGSRAA